MMAGRSDSKSPARWLRHARADLSLAEAAPPDGVLLELLCFHAQQAAEKAMKAVLLHLTAAPFPRTHDLVLLTDLLTAAGAPAGLPLTAEAAQGLTQYAVITRYPADLGEVDEAEWGEATAVARAVVEWAERAVTSPA